MIYIGLSGGIDSTYALYLLRKEFSEVTAVFLILFDQKDNCSLKCCNLENVINITKKLNVKLEIVDVREDFRKEIIDNFINEYKKGKTPNPCVLCNEKIKFKIIIENLLKKGDYIATGHYARIKNKNGNFYLLKGSDNLKDQSYMLYRIKKDYLSNIIFPLGSYKKENVIKEVERLNLYEKIPEESQDLCFLIDKKVDFLKETLPESKGYIIHINGNKLGFHKGYYFYTIGQREGLNISWKEPLYVIDIDPKNNVLYVGERIHTMKNEFIVKDLNWLYEINKKSFEAKVKTRYKSKEIDCFVDKIDGGVKVKLKINEFAITPGQSAVFYKNDIVLGGGIIEKVL
ncbi:MAG: tRNA 2-thiouridine(34) synthase MnmA [Caldisericia bacterium]